MSETTIENLPEEVLEAVFKWLDLKSLRNVEETSEEWKEIARSIPRTLRLDRRNMNASMDSLLASRRKYDKATIRGPVESQQKLLEAFAKHGANVQQLEIHRNSLNNAPIWCQVIKTMPKLKKVKIWYSRSDESWNDLNAESFPKEKDLNKMESLMLQGSDLTMLKLFNKCQLKTLSVNMCPNLQNREPLLNFLATQKSLEKLTLKLEENLFQTPIQHEFTPFRLKKLVLCQHNRYVTLNDNNLLKFLKLHAATLDELDINGKFSESFYEFVFGKLNHLKALRLTCTQLPKESSFYELLGVNEGVTSLELIGASDHQMLALKGVISHLPNIESLALHNIRERSVIQHVAETLKTLKKLDVDYFGRETFGGLRFDALQSFAIGFVAGSANWYDFTRNNPGITELSIEKVWKPEYIEIPITSNLKKLHTLTIKCELNCDENFFATIRRNCKELKSLNLSTKSLKVDLSTVADIPGLRVRNFPF